MNWFIPLRIKFLTLLVLLLYSPILGQTKLPDIKDNADLIFDSLITNLNEASTDTIRVNVLNEIAWHFAPSNYSKSIRYADSALNLSRKISWKKGEAFALKHKGEALRYSGNLKKSLLNHEVSLGIFEKLQDKRNTASLLSNIGISYNQMSDYLKAYEYFDKALNIFLELDHKSGIQKINVYLGILFQHLQDYTKALDKYEFALKYTRELNDKSSEGLILGNIGNIYFYRKEYQKAELNYIDALRIFEKLNDSYNYSLFISNLGNLFVEQKEYLKALNYNKQALKFYQEHGNEQQAANQLGNQGRIEFLMVSDDIENKDILNSKKLLDPAISNLNSAVKIFNEHGIKERQVYFLNVLTDLYKFKEDFESAFKTQEHAQQLIDSLRSTKINKKIASMSVEQDLKLSEKEIELLNNENDYIRLIKNILVFFAIILVTLSIFIYFLYKKKRIQNTILEENIKIRREVESALMKNEQELNKHKNNLEKIVAKRTIELENEIVERKRTEEDLLVAIDRVETANKAKTVFLENMSHELRTPLVGILGYSNLLSTEVQDKEFREMADGINRTGNRLLNTLSMVLDLARIESDKFEIHITEVDLKEELEAVYNNFKGAVSIKNIDFKLDINDGVKTIFTDSGMLKVIIENLVNNAIKFTKEGEISISTTSLIIDSKEYLDISVTDTGIGIKRNEIPMIFREFKQLSEGTLKDFQGTGLGLSISKRFTEHLQGKLLVESEFGVSSKFTVRLPVNN